jgi:hypothetical protein
MDLANVPFEAFAILKAQAAVLTFAFQAFLGLLPHLRECLSAGSIAIFHFAELFEAPLDGLGGASFRQHARLLVRAQVCFIMELVPAWTAKSDIVRMLCFIVTVANPGLLEDLIARAAFDGDLMHMCAMLFQDP